MIFDFQIKLLLFVEFSYNPLQFCFAFYFLRLLNRLLNRDAVFLIAVVIRDVAALEEYEELHSYFKRNPACLYSYAMASFKRGDLDRAARLIEECGRHWNGYNRELLAGDICSYREKYPDAIAHYEAACAMCPVRFAPLEGLYKVYDLTGDEERRNAIARQIADKDIKVYSSAIWQIKENCK